MRWRVKSSQYDDEFMSVTIKFQFLLSIRMSPFNDAACYRTLERNQAPKLGIQNSRAILTNPSIPLAENITMCNLFENK